MGTTFRNLAILMCALYAADAKAQIQVDSIFTSRLVQLAHKRIEAFDTGDTSIWSPYVANEYFIATPTGKIVTKSAVMAGFGPPLKGYRDVFEFEDIYIARDSNLAVMSYKIKEHEWWGKQDNEVPELRKTDTYVFRGNKWLLLASQETFYPVIRKSAKINTTSFKKLIGRYQVMPDLEYSIFVEDEKLWIRENSNPAKTELIPLNDHTFYCLPDTGYFNEGGTGEISFSNGKRDFLIFKRYGAITKAEKIR
ncbi:MAG TPA: nuclear transport factor 2 family protein [Flavisolibacter sp.]|jgi:hypothetical protein|nr:nuclear transport factor 2 family protein [Flavisolibacter sp.]